MPDRKKYLKEWREKNKEHILKYQREWLKRNKEYMFKYQKEYMEKWRKENKEHCIEYSKKYYQEHKEHIKKYHQENKEIYLFNFRKYDKTEKGKAANQRRHTKRQARERNIINTLTAQEWADILEAHNYRCAYCDVEFEVENMPHRDHIIPISKGGDNIKENVMPACKSCNSRKRDKILNKEVMTCLFQ